MSNFSGRVSWPGKGLAALLLVCLVFQGCATGPAGPAGEPKIDFDRFRAAPPDRDHCPDQDRLLAGIQQPVPPDHQTRVLHQMAAVIAAPCSQENYVQALKIAGDVFAGRKEYDQAHRFYREGLDHAGDEAQARVFRERLQTLGAQPSRKDPEKVKDTAFDPHRIGVMLPLTGFYQTAGERVLNGIRVAVEQMNRSGTGGPFRILVQDTRSDPSGAVAAVRELERSRAACIIGPMVTAAAAAEEAMTLEIPMIALSQEKGVAEAGEYVFQHFLTPERQAAALVSHVIETVGSGRFVVLFPENRYGQRFSRAFEQAVDDAGGEVTASVSYEPGQTDFSSLILPLIRGYQKLDLNRNFVDLAPGETRKKNRIYRAVIDADAVFIPDGPDTGAQIALQLRFHDIRDVILLGPNIWNRETMDRIWGEAPFPVVFPVDFDPDSPEEVVQDFVAEYEAAYDEAPDYFAAIGFEAAVQVMESLSDSGVSSRAAMTRMLRNKGLEESVVMMQIIEGQ